MKNKSDEVKFFPANDVRVVDADIVRPKEDSANDLMKYWPVGIVLFVVGLAIGGPLVFILIILLVALAVRNRNG